MDVRTNTDVLWFANLRGCLPHVISIVGRLSVEPNAPMDKPIIKAHTRMGEKLMTKTKQLCTGSAEV